MTTVRLTAAQGRDLARAIHNFPTQFEGVGTVEGNRLVVGPNAVTAIQDHAAHLDPYFARTFAAIARKVIDERGVDE